jgi:hypothetical protein
LRQLIDAGTLANLPAGFKARGARIADDSNPIQPGEWRDIDAGGAELAASLLPLPYKEPSQVLFALMGFLVDSGKRLSSTADMQVGDGNQYAQVGTTLALLERGSMVMSSIHKRLHYAQTLEFRLLFEGFGQYMPDEYPYDVPGASRKIKKADFDTMVSVQPVADPNIFSSAQRIQLAQMQLQLAQSAPNMHNMYEAYYRMYAALNIRDIDGVLLPQNTNMPRDPASENSDVLNGMKLKAFAGQQHDAHIATHLMMGMSPILQANPMSAAELQKHILDHIRLRAEEDMEVELFKQYGTDPDRMVSAIQREGMVAINIAMGMKEVREMQDKFAGGEGPDPLVQIKEKEIAQRAEPLISKRHSRPTKLTSRSCSCSRKRSIRPNNQEADMPLKKGSSRKTISSNIGEIVRDYKQDGMIGTSKPKSKAAAVKQAVAVAYSKAGKTKMAKGGGVETSKGVQGPYKIVKKKDGNRPVKIY